MSKLGFLPRPANIRGPFARSVPAIRWFAPTPLRTVCAVLVLWVSSGFAAPPNSSAQAPAATPSDDEILALSDEFQAIEASPCSSFKQTVWVRLASLLTERANSGLSLDALVLDGFKSLTAAKDFANDYATMQAALEAPKTASDGKHVVLQEDTVELLWTIGQIAGALEVELRASPLAKNADSLLHATEPEMRKVVENAIRRQHWHSNRLAKLRLLLKQTDPTLAWLGISRAQCQQWVSAYEPEIPANAGLETLASVVRQETPLAAYEDAMADRLKVVKDRIESRLAQARAALEQARRTLEKSELTVDLGGGAALSYKLIWPQVAPNATVPSYPAAELSLRLPRPSKDASYVVAASPADGTPPVPAGSSNATASTYDFPLGIRIKEVAVDPQGRPQIVPERYNTLGISDAGALAASLVKLGLPREVTIASAQVLAAETGGDKLGLLLQIKLPFSEATLPLHLRFVAGKVTAPIDPESFLKTIAGDELRAIEKEFLTRLKGLAAIPLLDGTPIKIKDVDVTGFWLDRTLHISAQVSLPEPLNITWKMSFAFQNLPGKGWTLTPEAMPVPGEVVDKLLGRLLMQVREKLDLPADKFAEFSRYAALAGVKYDPAKNVVMGDLRVKLDLFGSADTTEVKVPFTFPVTAPFEPRIGDGVLAAVKNQLADLAKKALDDLKKRAEQKVNGAVIAQLKDSKFSLPGLEIKITDATPVDGQFDLRCELLAAGKAFKIEGLRLLALQGITSGQLNAPKFDFSHCEVTPGLKELLAGLAGLQPDWLVISNLRPMPNGLVFQAEVKIEGLDWPVPLGEISLGQNGVSWDPQALTKALTQKAVEAFGERDLDFGGVGALKKVKINPDPTVTSFSRDFKLGFTGVLSLAGMVDLPIKVGFPGPKVTAGDLSGLVDQLKGPLKNLLPEGLPFEVSDLVPLSEKPYGISFSIHATVINNLTVDARDLRITSAGVDLPAALTVQINQPVYLGPYIVAVNPGVSIPLRGGGGVGILGDLALFAPGTDKVLKIDSRLTQIGELKDFHFRLEGTVVLVEKVAVFKVTGDADLGHGILNNDASTVGLLDKVLRVRGHQLVSGPERLMTQTGHVSVLGLTLGDLDTRLQLSGGQVRLMAKGFAQIPLGSSVEFQVNGQVPNLRDCSADGRVEARIGTYTLSSAELEIAWARAQLVFGLLGFKLTVITPGIDALSPAVVLRAIAEIFKFDFSMSFFSSLLKREIVIDLLDHSGKPTDGSVGSGQTPPPADSPPDESNNSSGDAPSPTASSTGSPDPSSSSPPGGEEKTNPPIAGALQQSQQGASVVRTYHPGSVICRFTPPDGPSLSTLNYEGGGRFHFRFTPAVRDYLKNPANVILQTSSFELPLRPGGEAEALCVNGFHHPFIEYFLTVNQSTGDLAVALSGDHGTVIPLPAAGSPVPEILLAHGMTSFKELLALDPANPKALQPGDCDLLYQWTRSQVCERYKGFDGIAWRDMKDWLKDEGFTLEDVDGYFFQRVDESGQKQACFQSRHNNWGFNAGQKDWIFTALADRGKDVHLRRLLAYHVASLATGRPLRLLYQSNATFDEVILCLAAATDNSQPAQLIYLNGNAPKDKHTLTLREAGGRPDGADFEVTGPADAANPNAKLETEFRQKLVQVLQSPGTPPLDEIRLGRVDGVPRAILTARLDQPDWELLAVCRRSANEAFEPQTLSTARIKGSALEQDYRTIHKPGEPAELNSRATREGFILRLLEPKNRWITHLEVDPLPYALP